MTHVPNCNNQLLENKGMNQNHAVQSQTAQSWQQTGGHHLSNQEDALKLPAAASLGLDAEERDGVVNGIQHVDPSSKKKTPMCLVNELARHHKLQPQYRLTDESGPPHQKLFTVTLKLGEEEYTASGLSIKKAQHATALIALQKTKYPTPPPKPKSKSVPSNQGVKCVTPTVELNALAMKMGLPTNYTNYPLVTRTGHQLSPVNYQNNLRLTSISSKDFRNFEQGKQEAHYYNADLQPRNTVVPARLPGYHMRGQYPRFPVVPMTHRVSLSVGDVQVVGEGPSPQAARHHAATLALEQLRARKASQLEEVKKQQDETITISTTDTDESIKSPVSLVHELALKLNQTVDFSVVSESGPPHMKVFVIRCMLGDMMTEGEGNCKKLAKKKSAENMLTELKRAYPNGIAGNPSASAATLRSRSKVKQPLVKKKPRNLVKEVAVGLVASSSSVAVGMQDPVSRLMQLQQARKEKEPTFDVISERGIPRQPEFIVQVTVGGLVAQGIGPKKKDAKKAAAQKALELLGVQGTANEAAVPAETSEKDAPGIGRQTIPGLLVVGGAAGLKPKPDDQSSIQKKETGSESVAATQKSQLKVNSSGGVRPKTRLLYLAQILGFEVEFTDFPKGLKGEFLSLVNLSTDPPQVCHGTGQTLEEAHDNVSCKVLQLLLENGLDSVASKVETRVED